MVSKIKWQETALAKAKSEIGDKTYEISLLNSQMSNELDLVYMFQEDLEGDGKNSTQIKNSK